MDIHPRRLVGIQPERVTNVSSTEFPGHYPDEDHSWDLDKFKRNLKIRVQRLSQRSIEFDLVGVDASIANAFRRIMIAEVPTVAIEHVYVFNNTTVIQDEVLAHRIGLVPLDVNPTKLDAKEPGESPTDRNTLEFKLELECKQNPAFTKASLASNPNPSDKDLYINHELLSSHLVWQPVGEQAERFADCPVKPLNPNIVLAKLRPGQAVDITLHAVKGIASDHAKWSPVATATYRLHPNVVIKKPIPFERAEEFAACFSKGVVKIDKKKRTVSIDPHHLRNDTVSREVLRDPEFASLVELSRIRDHFIFSVESESAYPPEQLLVEAINVMQEKVAAMKAAANALLSGGVVGEEEGDDVVMEDA
ncbi:hypothetical protein GYMLUDRAFT_72406 [Collybiopsis luxurians FD-317 M1]|uniref:DNA-directed RNA polymerases I and III subunit RPAC1 n=1 Tax=Collybiopsis luxurians FD-317 M1 TaxID=944289 RepID=A0A0D0C4W8_9AGAR|nr:hypothetical protein GYMLUDRAFT_72406 [Collybiopsis luxurians FD-317 M1]